MSMLSDTSVVARMVSQGKRGKLGMSELARIVQPAPHKLKYANPNHEVKFHSSAIFVNACLTHSLLEMCGLRDFVYFLGVSSDLWDSELPWKTILFMLSARRPLGETIKSMAQKHLPDLAASHPRQLVQYVVCDLKMLCVQCNLHIWEGWFGPDYFCDALCAKQPRCGDCRGKFPEDSEDEGEEDDDEKVVRDVAFMSATTVTKAKELYHLFPAKEIASALIPISSGPANPNAPAMVPKTPQLYNVEKLRTMAIQKWGGDLFGLSMALAGRAIEAQADKAIAANARAAKKKEKADIAAAGRPHREAKVKRFLQITGLPLEMMQEGVAQSYIQTGIWTTGYHSHIWSISSLARALREITFFSSYCPAFVQWRATVKEKEKGRWGPKERQKALTLLYSPSYRSPANLHVAYPTPKKDRAPTAITVSAAHVASCPSLLPLAVEFNEKAERDYLTLLIRLRRHEFPTLLAPPLGWLEDGEQLTAVEMAEAWEEDWILSDQFDEIFEQQMAAVRDPNFPLTSTKGDVEAFCTLAHKAAEELPRGFKDHEFSELDDDDYDDDFDDSEEEEGEETRGVLWDFTIGSNSSNSSSSFPRTDAFLANFMAMRKQCQIENPPLTSEVEVEPEPVKKPEPRTVTKTTKLPAKKETAASKENNRKVPQARGKAAVQAERQAAYAEMARAEEQRAGVIEYERKALELKNLQVGSIVCAKPSALGHHFDLAKIVEIREGDCLLQWEGVEKKREPFVVPMTPEFVKPLEAKRCRVAKVK